MKRRRPRLIRLDRNRGYQVTKLADDLAPGDRIFTEAGSARVTGIVERNVKTIRFSVVGVEYPYQVNLYRKLGELVPVVLEL